MKLGRKVGNTRLIRGEDLFLFFFLEVTMTLGEKSKREDQSSFFSREHQFLEILASGPEFEYPPLVATKIDKLWIDSE